MARNSADELKNLSDEYVKAMARHLSIQRKIDQLHDAQFFEKIPSTIWQMKQDWRNACVYWAKKFISCELRLSAFDRETYALLEEVWLDEVKQHIAYLRWVTGRGRYKWSTDQERDEDYLVACDYLRNLLADFNVKEDAKQIEGVVKHIKTYLTPMGELDPEKSREMVRVKAERLMVHLSPSEAIQQATTYCRQYYKNIIPAISDGPENHVREVLRSFYHGRGAASLPEIVNCFEATVAIAFLDANVVERLWAAGGAIAKQDIF